VILNSYFLTIPRFEAASCPITIFGARAALGVFPATVVISSSSLLFSWPFSWLPWFAPYIVVEGINAED
jgi:hypothetical protein